MKDICNKIILYPDCGSDHIYQKWENCIELNTQTWYSVCKTGRFWLRSLDRTCEFLCCDLMLYLCKISPLGETLWKYTFISSSPVFSVPAHLCHAQWIKLILLHGWYKFQLCYGIHYCPVYKCFSHWSVSLFRKVYNVRSILVFSDP